MLVASKVLFFAASAAWQQSNNLYKLLDMNSRQELDPFAHVRALIQDEHTYVAVKLDLNQEDYDITDGCYRSRVDGGESVDREYKAYLKIILRCCLNNLAHLTSVDLLSKQVSDAIRKAQVLKPGDGYYLPLDGFEKIFDKQLREHNISYCFYLVHKMVMRYSASDIRACNLGFGLQGFEPISDAEYEASKYKMLASQPTPNSKLVSPDIVFWRIDTKKRVDVDFFAAKLLILLASVGDEKSLGELLQCPLFAARDASTLAKCIDVAIGKRDSILLRRLALMLQQIEPRHPAIERAEIQIKRFALLARSSVPVEEINSMSGEDFELAVKEALEKCPKFESVKITRATGDFGADLIITTVAGTRIAIQCKRFATKVNLKAVQEVSASVKHYACDLGIVVSNNGFLASASELAKSNGIELWDGEAVLKLFAGQFDFSEVFSLA